MKKLWIVAMALNVSAYAGVKQPEPEKNVAPAPAPEPDKNVAPPVAEPPKEVVIVEPPKEEKEVVARSCPNGSRLQVTCTNRTKDLTVLLCPGEFGDPTLLVVNDLVMKAKRGGNYAAYADWTSNADGFNYELGLITEYGNYSHAFFNVTSEWHDYLSEGIDMDCVLPL